MERPPAPTPLSDQNARIIELLDVTHTQEESKEEREWRKRREGKKKVEEEKGTQVESTNTEVLPKQRKKEKKKVETKVDTTGTEVLLNKREERERSKEKETKKQVDTLGTEVLSKTTLRMRERKEKLGKNKRQEGREVRKGGVKAWRESTHHLLQGILAPHPRVERQEDNTLNRADPPTHSHPKPKVSLPHKRLCDPPLEDHIMDDVKAQMAVLQQQLAQLQQQQPQQPPPPLPKPIKEYKGGKFEGDRGIQVEDFLYALENQFAMQGVVDSVPKVLIATSGVVGPAAV